MLKDCARAIQLNSQASKAYYRSALALIALERFDEALDCCDRCLAFDKENSSVKAVRERAVKLANEKTIKAQNKQRKLMEKKLAKQRLQSAYRVRDIVILSLCILIFF